MSIYGALLVLLCFSVLKSIEANEMKLIEDNEMFQKECHDEHDIDEDLLNSVMLGKFDKADKNIKCFLRCIFLSAGYMFEDGTIDSKKISEDFSVEYDDFLPILRLCFGEKSDDPCEKAFRMMICMYDFYESYDEY